MTENIDIYELRNMLVERAKQELCRKYKLDEQNYYEDKASLDRNIKNMQILVDRHKKGMISQEDFWDIYQSYSENIDILKEKIDKISIKNVGFKKIGICNQKEIVRKYVDRVVISDYRKKNNNFSTKIVFDANYE